MSVFIPSMKEAMVIYAIPKIVNNGVLREECRDWYRVGKEFMLNKLSKD